MDESLARPPTAARLEELRARRRLSKQRLADLADVSATYVRYIEAGFDESGRQVVPSANVIQKLARGLALAEPDEARRAEAERQAYLALMAAAGYLPTEMPTPSPPSRPGASPAPPDGVARQPIAPGAGAGDVYHLRRDEPARGAKLSADPAWGLLALRDRRLGQHLRGLLEDWEALASEDQALLLGIAEFIAERRRRREGGA